MCGGGGKGEGVWFHTTSCIPRVVSGGRPQSSVMLLTQSCSFVQSPPRNGTATPQSSRGNTCSQTRHGAARSCTRLAGRRAGQGKVTECRRGLDTDMHIPTPDPVPPAALCMMRKPSKTSHLSTSWSHVHRQQTRQSIHHTCWFEHKRWNASQRTRRQRSCKASLHRGACPAYPKAQLLAEPLCLLNAPASS